MQCKHCDTQAQHSPCDRCREELESDGPVRFMDVVQDCSGPALVGVIVLGAATWLLALTQFLPAG